jgi:hypothetical protein
MRLIEMSPTLTPHDDFDCLGGNPEACSQLAETPRGYGPSGSPVVVGAILCTNCANLIVSQLRLVMRRAATGVLRARVLLSPLRPHVSEVVGLRPNKEMVRVATAPVVAMMENEQAVRDGAILHLPGQPVNVVCLPEDRCASVPVAPNSKLPLPASSLGNPNGSFNTFRERDVDKSPIGTVRTSHNTHVIRWETLCLA